MIWKIKTSLLNILLLGSCLHKIQKKCSLNKDMKSQLVTQKKAKKAQLSWGNFYADSYGSGKVDYTFLTTAHR